MSKCEQERFLINYFKENEIDISLLNKMDCVYAVKSAVSTYNLNMMRKKLIRRRNK